MYLDLEVKLYNNHVIHLIKDIYPTRAAASFKVLSQFKVSDRDEYDAGNEEWERFRQLKCPWRRYSIWKPAYSTANKETIKHNFAPQVGVRIVQLLSSGCETLQFINCTPLYSIFSFCISTQTLIQILFFSQMTDTRTFYFFNKT